MPNIDFNYLHMEDLTPKQVSQVLIGLLDHLKLTPIITREVCGTSVPADRESLQFMDADRNVVSDLCQSINGIT